MEFFNPWIQGIIPPCSYPCINATPVAESGLSRVSMSRPIPPLNPLRTFEVAARHLSFTRAAEELFVTAAAVSHQIKTLEESLGVVLFVRQPKLLELTKAGAAYLPDIQRAFKQMAEATHQLHCLLY